MRALLIANDDDADLGVIGRLASEAGYRFEVLSCEEPEGWPLLDGVDLVLSLGSEWSVYWDHVGASVAAEAALLAAAHGAAVPVLGICFGAQMVAHALGATVSRAPFAEIGWYEIDSSYPDVVAPGPWFELHVDTFTVPAGATELARSAVGPARLRRSSSRHSHKLTSRRAPRTRPRRSNASPRPRATVARPVSMPEVGSTPSTARRRLKSVAGRLRAPSIRVAAQRHG